MSSILIDKLLQTVIARKASDLYLTVGEPPVLRLDGWLQRLETKNLEPEDVVAIMRDITPHHNQQELQEAGRTEFKFAFGEKARFRVSVFNKFG